MTSGAEGNATKEHHPHSLYQPSKIRRSTRLQENLLLILFLITIRYKVKRVIMTHQTLSTLTTQHLTSASHKLVETKSNNPTSRTVLHKPTLINFRHPQTTGLQAHISCVHTPSKRTSRGSVVISHNTWFCEENNEYAIILVFSLSFLSTRCLPAKGGGRVDLRFVTDKKRQL